MLVRAGPKAEPKLAALDSINGLGPEYASAEYAIMQYVIDFYNSLDAWVRQYVLMIAMAQVATLLVVFGDHINAIVRVLVKPYPFVVRVGAFVALCAFGYGALTAFTTPLYAKLLAMLNGYMLTPVILVTFILIGMLAERGLRRTRLA